MKRSAEIPRKPHTFALAPAWVQYRYVLMFFGFLGLASVFAMRVNINVDMVVMVNQSAIAANSNSSRSTHQQVSFTSKKISCEISS